jgi:hypothetical protein
VLLGRDELSFIARPAHERAACARLVVLLRLLVAPLLVDAEEAVELQDGPGRAETGSGPASMSMVVWSKTAGIICEATNRCQIRR